MAVSFWLQIYMNETSFANKFNKRKIGNSL